MTSPGASTAERRRVEVDADHIPADVRQVVRESPFAAPDVQRALATGWHGGQHDRMVVDVPVPRATSRGAHDSRSTIRFDTASFPRYIVRMLRESTGNVQLGPRGAQLSPGASCSAPASCCAGPTPCESASTPCSLVPMPCCVVPVARCLVRAAGCLGPAARYAVPAPCCVVPAPCCSAPEPCCSTHTARRAVRTRRREVPARHWAVPERHPEALTLSWTVSQLPVARSTARRR